jgi:hypothetical protein
MLICQSQQDLCYKMRFWGIKKAIADMPAPKCTKTRQGLMCLLSESKAQQKKGNASKTTKQ